MSWGLSVYNESGNLVLDTSSTLTHYSHTVQNYTTELLGYLDSPSGKLIKVYFDVSGFSSDGTWFYTQPVYYRNGVLDTITWLHQTTLSDGILSFVFVEEGSTTPTTSAEFYIDIMRV